MDKITTEIRYNEMSFDFVKENKGLKMYIDTDQSYCIITDKEGNILFKLRADCGQNAGYLEEDDS
jgi:hypothetical protein